MKTPEIKIYINIFLFYFGFGLVLLAPMPYACIGMGLMLPKIIDDFPGWKGSK